MKMLNENLKREGKNSHKAVRTASLLFLTLVFAMVLSGAASAGTPLAENQTGTVSGDLYVNTTDGWPSSIQGATNEVTQANTLPTYTSIDSAMVYVNVYSGSGTSNWPVRTTVKIDANGDGDYDDPGELLGVEDMNIPGITDGTVYWLNDHCNRVYSDYQVWYDVTGLITSNNPTLYVKTESMGGEGYDGRIKLLALTVAYNDGDTDQVHYWVLNGQDWINTDTSPSISTFNTHTFNGQITNATLNTIALSSTDGTYTLNTSSLTGNLTETGSFYKEHQWDVTSSINTGADTTMTYTNVGSSFKMNLATLAIRESVIYNGLADTAWPKYQGNNQNTGQSPYNGPQTNTVLWIYTNEEYPYFGGSTSIGADGTIFIGDWSGKLYAINPNGTLKWAYTTGGEIYSSPSIAADGTIYTGSASGNFYAINPDGTLKWTYTIGGSTYGSSAIIADGTIYIVTYDRLYAINPDGTLKWTYNTGGQFRNSPAIAADGTIYIGSLDNKLSAINPDGTLKWAYTTGDQIYSSPSIGTDGTIYIGSGDGKLYAINPDGTLKWTYTTSAYFDRSSPAIAADGTIYIVNYEYLYAINPDGTLKWTYAVYNESSPVIGADGTIYIGDYWGIYALNPDGTLKWTYGGTNPLDASTSPVIAADGTLYIGGYEGLYAFKNPYKGLADTAWPKYQGNNQNTGQSPYNGPQTNTVLWTCTTGYIVSSPVIAADGTIYIADETNLNAINPDGALKWTYLTGSYIYGSPAISADGTIYIADENNFNALNPDGTLKWTYSTGSYGSPAIAADGTIYLLGDALYALNPDGTLKWTYRAGNLYASPAIATDGTIYIGNYWDLNALNPDGTLKWTSTIGAPIGSVSIAADGTIYVVGNNNSILYALNPDGSRKWSISLGYMGFYSPAIATDGTIYIGNDDGNLFALNPDGTTKWNYTIGGYINGSPVIGADGIIYIGSDTGLYAINPDGTVKWTNAGEIYVSPAISADGTLYIGINDTVYAFKDPAVPLVADFASSDTTLYAGQTVQFTDLSTGLPTSWDWNFGDESTSSDQNPTHQYSTPGTYNVQLIVSNENGSDDEVKTDYISVVADTEPPVVNVDTVTGTYNPPVQVTLSATDNMDPNPNIYYTLDGSDPTTSSSLYTIPLNIPTTTTLKFIATDARGNTSSVQSETYTIVDTEAPNVTASQSGTLVTLSATDNGDPNPAIYYTTDGTDPTTGSTPYSSPFNIPRPAITLVKFIAADVSGNTSLVQSKNCSTYYSTDILTGYYAEGNVGVSVAEYGSYGWFAYNEAGTGTATFTTSSLNIPAGANILSARLYQAWTWRGYPEYTLQFNGNTIPTTVHYVDGNDGQDFYDVTAYFNQNTDNTAVITANGGCSYATILIVVYQSNSEPYRKIWVNEGFDIIPGYSGYGATEGPGTAFFNNVTNTNIGNAQIITLLPSGDNDSPNILLNGQTFTISSTGGSDPAYKYYNINPAALQNGTNVVEVPNGGYMSISNAILTLTMQPGDLTITNLQTNNPQVGASSPVTATLTNNGGSDAFNFLVKLYDNNVQVAKTTINSLASGASNPVSFNWTPTTIGKHVLAVIADVTNQITESDENNNLVSAEVTVNPSAQPDLIASNLQLPVSPVIGTTSPVSVTITNPGAVNSDAFVVKLYDNNTQYATINLTGLSAGTSTDVIFDWLTYTTGQHNLSVIADANQQITEYNEANNQLSQQATVSQSILPDLTVTNLQVPASPVVAASSQITATVTNLGTIDSGAFVVKLYDNNTQIAKINLIGLVTGVSTDVTFNWSTLTSGAHNLSVIADANQQITEYNENNNQLSQQTTVNPSTQPDLTVTNIQLPANPVAGTTYQITATVTNMGTVDTTAFAVKLYDNNTQLGKINITSLAAGTSTQVTFNWTPITGTHNLLIKADANQQITEYNETNNTITQQTTVN